MAEVGLKQGLEAMSKLFTKPNWSAISSEGLQKAIDAQDIGEQFTLFLANGGRMQIVMTTDGITVPDGGRIRVVAVPVNESRDWSEAVKAAGPNTGRDWAIWRMGDQYPPREAGSGLTQVILVHFGPGKHTKSEDNIAWAKSQGLVPASPRKVFAVGEYCPTLHRDLGMDSMAVVSLKQCSFEGGPYCICVWFGGSGRRARGDWFDCGWSDDDWFAFVRESELEPSAP